MGDVQQNSGGGGVSPARKAISALLLVAALVVLAIELRASLGQSNSGKALAAMSTDGVFENTPLEDAKAALAFSPTETVIRDTDFETVYQYRWNSLLLPLMQKPPRELFLVATKADQPRALAFYTDPEDAGAGFYGDPVFAEEAMGGSTPEAIDMPAPGVGQHDAAGGGGSRPGGDRKKRSRPDSDAGQNDQSSPAPEGDAPAADAPTADAPVSDEPAVDAPGSDEPAADAPSTEVPLTDDPNAD